MTPLSAMNHTLPNITLDDGSTFTIPQWAIELEAFRMRLFVFLIEPIIELIIGPESLHVGGNASSISATESYYPNTASLEEIHCESNHSWPCSKLAGLHADAEHRRLDVLQQFNLSSLLPEYVQNVQELRENGMTFGAMGMLFFIMSCVFGVFFSCFYHSQKTSHLFTSPRRHRLPKLVPPPLPVDSAFSWVKICFFLSDEEIINRIGFDSLIFLRFHRLALRCIVKMSIFSFLVLLPLNYTGGAHNDASDLREYVNSLLFSTDFLLFTMANVSNGSWRLSVHCFAGYLLTGIVVRELLVEYEAFNSIRHRYLLSKEPHLRTVLVTNIPRHLRSPEKLGNYFKNVYPNAVKSVSMCQNLVQMERLISKRTALLSRIEHELLILCRREKRKLVGVTKIHKILCNVYSCRCMDRCLERCGCRGGTQDRLTKLYSKLEEINNKIQNEQNRRRRVMRRLDQMDSAKGSKEIDYVLSTPVFEEKTKKKKKGSMNGQNSNSQQPHSSISNPTAQSETHTPAGDNDPRLVGLSSGPTKRSNASGATPSASNLPEVEVVESPVKLVNGKQLPPSAIRAKSAIRRYSKMARHVSFLGRPVTSEPSDATPPHKNSLMSGRDSDFVEYHINEVTDKAFVVMNTFTASTIAIQSMHSSKPGSMQVDTAPEPRDILWSNIYVSKGARRTRSYFGDALALLIITLYVFPIALVSMLVSETALVSSSTRLEQLHEASAFFASGIAMVQPLCIVGIQQLLPPLFIFIGQVEGRLSFSEVQMTAFSRYFLFQVVNVFLVTTVSGTVFQTVAVIVERPEAMLIMLGNSLPRLSSFFITLVTLKTFLGLGVELVRIAALLQSLIRFILCPNATLRAQRSRVFGMRAIDDPGWFAFHKILAQDMLIVVIGMVFAVVAPMVLLPCALFCAFSRVVWTHHHLYVYESVFETGGQFWPKIFRRFVFGLITAQATISGQFIVKEARQEAYAMIALMFFTYVFLRSTRARYDAPSSTLPLEVATVMDLSLGHEQEAARRRQRQQLSQMGSSGGSVYATSTTPTESEVGLSSDAEDSNLGARIGDHDPFQNAYDQPALRACPRARPEQPFPPAQLGSENVLFNQINDARGSTLGAIGDDDPCDGDATVRLRSMNKQDRRLVDRWWSDQIQRSGEQDFLAVLIGQQCGTLMIGKRASLVESDRIHNV